MLQRATDWFKDVLPQQNALIASFEPLTMAALPCNQNAMCLGGIVQARNSLFYLVDYVTKDSHLLANVASALSYAMNKVTMYPSTAADTGNSDS